MILVQERWTEMGKVYIKVNRLRKIMGDKGYNQAKLSRTIGVDQAVISRIMNGRNISVGPKTISGILNGLNMKFDDIFFYDKLDCSTVKKHSRKYHATPSGSFPDEATMSLESKPISQLNPKKNKSKKKNSPINKNSNKNIALNLAPIPQNSPQDESLPPETMNHSGKKKQAVL